MKVINPPPSENSYVYHYTQTDKVQNFILKNRTLRLNPFEKVNDPKEYKQFELTCFTPVDSNISREVYESLTRKIELALKKDVKLACFSMDRPVSEEKLWSEPHTSRGWAKPSMWHHYGGEHDGVCLLFDRVKLNEALKRQLPSAPLVHGKVAYSNQGAVPNDWVHPFSVDFVDSNEIDLRRATLKHLSRWAGRLYFEKLEDWSNETEYRWIYLDSVSGPRDVEFGDSLQAIVIGERVSETARKNLIDECKSQNIEICLLGWRNGYPYPTPLW